MMTKRTQSRLLRSITFVARAMVTAFLMIPGAGIALVAAACGDIDLSADPTPDALTIVDTVTAPEREPVPLAPVMQPMLAPLPAPERVAAPEAIAVEPPPAAALAEGDTLGEDIDHGDARAELLVAEATLARGVAGRQPIGRTQRFEVGEKAWAWVTMNNQGDATKITMLWRREGQVRSRMTLEVGQSPRWRTWSRHTLRPSDVGQWTVEVRDHDGDLIETLGFEVIPQANEVKGPNREMLGC